MRCRSGCSVDARAHEDQRAARCACARRRSRGSCAIDAGIVEEGRARRGTRRCRSAASSRCACSASTSSRVSATLLAGAVAPQSPCTTLQVKSGSSSRLATFSISCRKRALLGGLDHEDREARAQQQPQLVLLASSCAAPCAAASRRRSSSLLVHAAEAAVGHDQHVVAGAQRLRRAPRPSCPMSLVDRRARAERRQRVRRVPAQVRARSRTPGRRRRGCSASAILHRAQLHRVRARLEHRDDARRRPRAGAGPRSWSRTRSGGARSRRRP